jgi:hypothetical protein
MTSERESLLAARSEFENFRISTRISPTTGDLLVSHSERDLVCKYVERLEAALREIQFAVGDRPLVVGLEVVRQIVEEALNV